jgi:hypothetical protein
MSYKSFSSISHTMTGSVPADLRKSTTTMSCMAMETRTTLSAITMETRTSWSWGSREKKEENGISGLEKMKVEVKVWSRKMEDMRMELVQMRVETSLAWSDFEIEKGLELGKELEMLKDEVNSTP